jgi:hypothetical protein
MSVFHAPVLTRIAAEVLTDRVGVTQRFNGAFPERPDGAG